MTRGTLQAMRLTSIAPSMIARELTLLDQNILPARLNQGSKTRDILWRQKV